MPITTRYHIDQGTHPPIIFEELPSPIRCPRKLNFDTKPIFDEVEEDISTSWFDPLDHIGTTLDTPLETPRIEFILSFTMSREERNRRGQPLRQLEREKKDYVDKQTSLMATRINANIFGENNAYVNPFEKNGNKTPPRTPRSHLNGFESPPRSSHHGYISHRSQHGIEVDNDITHKNLLKFQQDDYFQKLVLKNLDQNGDKYFMDLVSEGLKFPHKFHVQK